MTMQMAEICPVCKKLNLSKENYRSANLGLLIMFSKLFERLMAEQLTNFLKTYLIHKILTKSFRWQQMYSTIAVD